ncbi:1256_t:CDS:1 [Gigaspora margarita]|uniref:1256_t:CDS:1 n=1 Tax=Gigaspora margarita TaxID=4874 RepID=A0ABN7UVV5_GIGMA|nr:1256_t:CDS:1 [Gigaspora margarita]
MSVSSSTISSPSTTSTISESNSSSSSPTHFGSMIPTTAIVIMVLIVILSFIIICFYKRHQRRCKMSPILQFEVMHSRVVVVDADGKSLARNNSVGSTDSDSSGKDNKSTMVQVLQYNNNTKDGQIESDHSKNLCYEYL